MTGHRYDEYTRIHLIDPDQEPIRLAASLCTDCGVVVVDRAVHDRFHSMFALLRPAEETRP